MAADHSLRLTVQSLTIDASSYTAASPRSFTALVDSAIPYLWLPTEICNIFADEFGLEYLAERNYYFVNESSRLKNHNTKKKVTFTLARNSSSSEIVSVTLPYEAFDLQLSYPISLGTPYYYFPIRRAKAQNILGRAFLQEAYLIVDYERSNFSINPALFPGDSTPPTIPQLVAIYNTTYVPSVNNAKTPGLSGGAIGGIVAGCVILFLVIGGLSAFFFLRKRRRAREEAAKRKSEATFVEMTDYDIRLKEHRASELPSPDPGLDGFYRPGHRKIGSDESHELASDDGTGTGYFSRLSQSTHVPPSELPSPGEVHELPGSDPAEGGHRFPRSPRSPRSP